MRIFLLLVFGALGTLARYLLQGVIQTQAGGTFPSGTVLPVDSLLINEYRRVLGCTYGSSQPTVDFPMMVDMYMNGKLRLDELISLKRPLSEINEVLTAIQTGLELRTVVTNPGWS